MFKNNKQNPIQFIPKSINEKSNNNNNNIIKNNNTKLSYEEIRKIIENKNDKEVSKGNEQQIKNKFSIV